MRFFHRGSESFHLTIEHNIIEDIDGFIIGPFFSDYGVDVFSVFQLIISMSDPDLIIQINITHKQRSDSKISTYNYNRMSRIANHGLHWIAPKSLRRVYPVHGFQMDLLDESRLKHVDFSIPLLCKLLVYKLKCKLK